MENKIIITVLPEDFNSNYGDARYDGYDGFNPQYIRVDDCPLARAVKRTLGEEKLRTVGSHSVRFKDDSYYICDFGITLSYDVFDSKKPYDVVLTKY